MFFFVPLHSECFWKHFKSLFGPKACLGMVRGGLWGKECAPKSFECPVRDRKSSILNRGDFPGIAPEPIKIDVLVIGVLFEKLKLEMLNTGPNGAPGGPAGVPGRPGAPFWVRRGDLEGKGHDSGGSQVGPWRVKKWSGTVFLRSQRVKYTYFQGFEHVKFVNLMWSLEAPGPS